MPSPPLQRDLDSEVLGWLLDDFESSTTLAGDIERATSTPVTEAQVAAALERLCAAGLADRFVFQATSGSYVPAPGISSLPDEQFWYLASEQGRKIVEA